jgi:hypothetical protein
MGQAFMLRIKLLLAADIIFYSESEALLLVFSGF